MTRLIRTLILCIAVLLVADAQVASAHSGKQTYVYLNLYADGVEGRIEYPVRDLAPMLGVDSPAGPASTERFASDQADAIRAYSADHLALGEGSSSWDVEFGTPEVLAVAGGYIVVPFTVQDEISAAPRSFRVDFDAIIHANDQKDALLIIENDWGTATFNNEDGPIAGFSVGMTTQQVSLDDASTITAMGAVRGVGTDAVRVGIDQLLFVVALVLPLGLVARGATVFGPAPRVADALRRLGWALLLFAGGSSLTLWFVGLGAIDISARATGTVVAASLLVASVVAMWRLTDREEPIIFLLGMAQGLGLGLAFTDASLDRTSSLWTLLAFNIGAGVAVVIIVALVFPVLLVIRRTVAAPIALFGTASIISLYAVAWLVERVGDRDLDIERVANPFRVWPRNMWIMVLFLLASGALYWWTASRDRLRPLTATETPERVPADVPAPLVSR